MSVWRLMAVLALAVSLDAHAAEEEDPWRGVNGKTFWFNDHVDRWVLEPVARGWDWVAPDRVEHSVANFFRNLRFPIVTVNDLLQAKLKYAGVETARFAINTTVGLAGFFDPASHWGLEVHDEDFGQTLGVWGVPPGPYLVLPLLGPSTPRDTAGLVVDAALSVIPWFVPWWASTGAAGANTVNARALAIEDIDALKAASFDWYAAVRNGYLQRRRSAVSDEAPRTDIEDEDLYNIAPVR
jgi:phospholipid-binding lipoprotein MlaA